MGLCICYQLSVCKVWLFLSFSIRLSVVKRERRSTPTQNRIWISSLALFRVLYPNSVVFHLLIGTVVIVLCASMIVNSSTWPGGAVREEQGRGGAERLYKGARKQMESVSKIKINRPTRQKRGSQHEGERHRRGIRGAVRTRQCSREARHPV